MDVSDKLRSSRQLGYTLTELLVVIGIIAVLAAFLFPVVFRVRKQADVSVCISNERQLLAAMKMYEADYGELPVHDRGEPGIHWLTMIDPYVKSKDGIYVCPADKTHGDVYQWGGTHKCSYINFYTVIKLGKGGVYREPSPMSPLVGCRAHLEYQVVLGRYDGSIELPPRGRYPKIGVTFEGDADASGIH